MTNLPYLIGATALIFGVAVIASGARDEGGMPDLNGAVAWLNSPPLSDKALRGKVVLVNFWTYSWINSLRELPHMKAWAAKYKDAGLVVIGVHAPEFGFEKDPANVTNAISDLESVANYRQTVLNAYQQVEDNLVALHILNTESALATGCCGGVTSAFAKPICRWRRYLS